MTYIYSINPNRAQRMHVTIEAEGMRRDGDSFYFLDGHGMSGEPVAVVAAGKVDHIQRTTKASK